MAARLVVSNILYLMNKICSNVRVRVLKIVH